MNGGAISVASAADEHEHAIAGAEAATPAPTAPRLRRRQLEARDLPPRERPEEPVPAPARCSSGRQRSTRLARMRTTTCPGPATRIRTLLDSERSVCDCDRPARRWRLARVRLHGIHHVTCITGDAPANLDYYAGSARTAARREDRQPGRSERLPPLLRRRARLAGADMRFVEYPGDPRPRRERHGPPVVWRVGAEEALDFWERAWRRERRDERRQAASSPTRRASRSSSPSSTTDDPPLVAEPPGDPEEHALRGLRRRARLRADPERARSCWRTRSASRCRAWAHEARGERAGLLRLRPAAGRARHRGAGTVHHVALASRSEEHEAWLERVREPAASRRR